MESCNRRQARDCHSLVMLTVSKRLQIYPLEVDQSVPEGVYSGIRLLQD